MNVRFEWKNTKITLKPGQRLSHYTSGPHDEGYSYSAVTFEYFKDESAVRAECTSGGVDCDGHVARYTDLILDVNQRWRGWQIESESQYDQYAQAANY